MQPHAAGPLIGPRDSGRGNAAAVAPHHSGRSAGGANAAIFFCLAAAQPGRHCAAATCMLISSDSMLTMFDSSPSTHAQGSLFLSSFLTHPPVPTPPAAVERLYAAATVQDAEGGGGGEDGLLSSLNPLDARDLQR